ncbi:(S)-ureidoglycine aminohydrolase isoform X2 [Elaeis guineensis]|uniref:(S)-ureidoglycine aminohydrolase isoform X2 n=1 Tax=Elaeis guineensis var. tenera TaxID=51953 RepID=A0A6I9R3C8_ELAGV|nr:(S)-ureidoglycine aminohydrolase isoform X2 [Elaeis guineensis]
MRHQCNGDVARTTEQTTGGVVACAPPSLRTLSLAFPNPHSGDAVTLCKTLLKINPRNPRMLRSASDSSRPFHALLLFLLRWAAVELAFGEEGFCSASLFTTDSNSQPLYWKVTNPTLSPTHLQDLPGFTRSVYKRDHALIAPESHVFSPLPDWINTLGAYLISPAMGAHFTMYLAKMQENSKSGLPPKDVERYVILEDHYPEQIIGSTDKQPLLETPGEVFELRKLLPTSAPYDFNIHIMDFQPGEYLNVKEVHYNQHGLLLLEGQGIYRLGDSWYPIQAGDAIWMAPFVPQWYAALGKTRSRYLLYKDVNRNPL